MPTVDVPREYIRGILGEEYIDDEKFENLCFDFGIELDEVVMLDGLKDDRTSDIVDNEKHVIYKIEVPANRIDLLSMEGLGISLMAYLKKKIVPDYQLLEPGVKVMVNESVNGVREFVHCAVLRGIRLTQQSYDSLISLQEKLHVNFCRNRTLASIGIHDLDTIEPPFFYLAQDPKEIRFMPLEFSEEVDGHELMERLQSHTHLKRYLPIIKEMPKYPVFRDKNNVVLSLPPIINGNHTKIHLNTRNVFIEVTSTDQTKGKIVLDILVTTFSQYCDIPFTIEKVIMEYSNGVRQMCPEWPVREVCCDIRTINGTIGVSLTVQQIWECLTRMCLDLNSVSDEKNRIFVRIPYSRPDVMHSCDVIEDIAIAYGYNNLVRKFPEVSVMGSQLPINKLSDELRYEMARMGLMEVFSFVLTARDDNYKKLNLPYDGQCVEIAKPKGNIQICRTWLLPGMLNFLANNKSMPLPIRIFEVGDIVTKNPDSDVGASNRRQLGIIVQNNKSSGFEVIHGMLDRIMSYLECSHKNWSKNQSSLQYFISEVEHPTFFPGRCSNVILNGKVVGILGVLHPDVLLNFRLTNPASALVFEIEPFL